MLSNGRAGAAMRSTRGFRRSPQGLESLFNASDRETPRPQNPRGGSPAADARLSVDGCRSTPYTKDVIQSFRHRGLKALYEGERSAKIALRHIPKLERILAALDRSSAPEGMDIPGFRLHPLKDGLKGHYAVSVSGNWRVTCRFEEGRAADVDYLDYH